MSATAWIGIGRSQSGSRFPLAGFVVQVDRSDALDELRRIGRAMHPNEYPEGDSRDKQIAWLRKRGFRVKGVAVP